MGGWRGCQWRLRPGSASQGARQVPQTNERRRCRADVPQHEADNRDFPAPTVSQSMKFAAGESEDRGCNDNSSLYMRGHGHTCNGFSRYFANRTAENSAPYGWRPQVFSEQSRDFVAVSQPGEPVSDVSAAARVTASSLPRRYLHSLPFSPTLAPAQGASRAGCGAPNETNKR